MNRVANHYAQGLYSLAAQEGLTQRILGEMTVLNEAFSQQTQYLRLLSAPNIPKQERCQILDQDFRGKIEPYLLNFLKILTEKGYIRQFDSICKAYREQYNLDNGILPVRAVTAVALDEKQREKLKNKLETLTGKTVELSNTVDPKCLGGVRLDYDGKRVDATVENRLSNMASLLKNTVL